MTTRKQLRREVDALSASQVPKAQITEILDRIPGAWERTQEGLAQAARGEGTPLDELARDRRGRGPLPRDD